GRPAIPGGTARGGKAATASLRSPTTARQRPWLATCRMPRQLARWELARRPRTAANYRLAISGPKRPSPWSSGSGPSLRLRRPTGPATGKALGRRGHLVDPTAATVGRRAQCARRPASDQLPLGRRGANEQRRDLGPEARPARSSGRPRRGAQGRQDRENLRPVLVAGGRAAGREHLGGVESLADPALDGDRRTAAVAGDPARRDRAAVGPPRHHCGAAARLAADVDVDGAARRSAGPPAADGGRAARGDLGAGPGRGGGLLVRTAPTACHPAGREHGQDAHGDGARVTAHGGLLPAQTSCPVPEGSGITTP